MEKNVTLLTVEKRLSVPLKRLQRCHSVVLLTSKLLFWSLIANLKNTSDPVNEFRRHQDLRRPYYLPDKFGCKKRHIPMLCIFLMTAQEVRSLLI